MVIDVSGCEQVIHINNVFVVIIVPELHFGVSLVMDALVVLPVHVCKHVLQLVVRHLCLTIKLYYSYPPDHYSSLQ